MHDILAIDAFLKTPGPIFDVRSPGEFTQGNIPSAFNLPLFSDHERAAVGTTYKKINPEEAFLLGLEYVGPKMRSFAEAALQKCPQGSARIYCWRGGMRSQSMAWLFKTSGIRPSTLAGGYKSFRCWALDKLSQPMQLRVVGGLTGSGKTSVLHQLKALGEQVIDLEALAQHRGSAFGDLGMPAQPTSEQFENGIATVLHTFNLQEPIWIEDESRMIGTCKIPDTLFQTLRKSPLILLERPLDERVQLLLDQYGTFPENQLIEATLKLTRRLGGARTLDIQQKIAAKEWKAATAQLLEYYDSSYLFSTQKSGRKPSIISAEGLTSEEWALKIKGYYEDQ